MCTMIRRDPDGRMQRGARTTPVDPPPTSRTRNADRQGSFVPPGQPLRAARSMQLNIGCFPMAPMTDPKPAYLRITLLEDPSAPPHVAAALQGIVPEAMGIRGAGETALARALDEFAPDVVLCHEPLTTFSAREALAVTQARRPETPLLIVAPAFNESTLETLKARGAPFCLTAA